MKRAITSTAGILILLAFIAAAFGAVRQRGRPGPRLIPTPIDAARLATIVAEEELTEGFGTRRHIVFGRRYPGTDPYDFHAAIVVVKDHFSMEVPLDETEFGGQMWVHAERSRDGKRIWALADNAVESPGWTLALVASADGGITWHHLSTVPKPYYWGTFESFRMNEAGVGSVGIRMGTPFPAGGRGEGAGLSRWLRALLPEEEIVEEEPEGLYVYRTDDGGLTWSGPEYFESDTENTWEIRNRALPGFRAPP